MEETTSILTPKGGTIPLTNRTPRVNDFLLPPIGENEFINMNKKNGGNNRHSSTGAKSQRADSGIGELDHQQNNGNINNNNGWVSPVNGSDYGEFNNKENYKKNGLKKNPTSSTLNSYGQSSNQSKQTSSVFSSKNSHNVENSNNNNNSNNNTIKSSRRLSGVINKTEDAIQEQQVTKPHNQHSPVLTRNNSDSNDHKLILNRQNSQLTRKTSVKQQPPQPQPHHHQQQPLPKPRQNGDSTQRSNSLQRQHTFMTDTGVNVKNNNKNQLNLKQRNSFTGSNKIKIPNTNINNSVNTRPSTSTSNNYQQVPQQKASKINTIDNDNSNLNNIDVEVQTLGNIHDFSENARRRIYDWLEEVEKCTLLRPPSALSWFGVQNTGTVTSKQQKKVENKNTDENSNKNVSHDPEFDLSEYDSSDEQMVEYNRVVDKTYCVVYEQ
jgi:hypothetical protein